MNGGGETERDGGGRGERAGGKWVGLIGRRLLDIQGGGILTTYCSPGPLCSLHYLLLLYSYLQGLIASDLSLSCPLQKKKSRMSSLLTLGQRSISFTLLQVSRYPNQTASTQW